jgi:DNA replication protein DnaC
MNNAEAQRERHAMSVGPRGFQGITDAVAWEKMNPRIRASVLEHQPTEGFLLLGPTGAGKSLGAMMALRRAVRSRKLRELSPGFIVYQPVKVFWASAIDLAHADRRHRLGDGAPDVVHEAISAELCVLDDLLWGAKDDSLLEVISGRYNANKPTIATAGSRYEEVQNRLGDAAVRRLLECSGSKGIILDLYTRRGGSNG